MMSLISATVLRLEKCALLFLKRRRSYRNSVPTFDSLSSSEIDDTNGAVTSQW